MRLGLRRRLRLLLHWRWRRGLLGWGGNWLHLGHAGRLTFEIAEAGAGVAKCLLGNVEPAQSVPEQLLVWIHAL